MKTFLINVVTTAVSVIVCVILIETGLRLYYFGSLTPFIGGPKLYRPDQKLGFSLNPGMRSSQQRVAFIVPVTTNSFGLRGPEPGNKGSRFRIAILGDSHTFGSGLRDEESLPARLEADLNRRAGKDRFQVINAGSPAHSTVQELLQMRRLAPRLDADLWILAYTPENDIHYNTAALRNRMTGAPRRPVADIEADDGLVFDYSGAERYFRKNSWRLQGELRDRGWYENTAVYLRGKIAWKSFGGRSSAPDPNIFLGRPFLKDYSPAYSLDGTSPQTYKEIWDHGWRVTQLMMQEMQSLAVSNGAKFAMISMPADVQVEKSKQEAALKAYPTLKLDLTRGNRELEEFGQAQSIPVFDVLSPVLAARDAGLKETHYSLFDSHMRPATHEIMAKALARDLLASGQLPEN